MGLGALGGSATSLRVVGLLLLDPGRAWTLAELGSALGPQIGRRTLIRGLNRLVADGFVTKVDPPHGYLVYGANTRHRLYAELRGIAVKTLGGVGSPADHALEDRRAPGPPASAQAGPSFAVVGSTTVDIFLTGLDRIPGAGSDEFTTDAIAFVDDAPAVVIGGNGANTAYVLAGLGEQATLCSVIGDDLPGSIVLGWLRGRAMSLDGLAIGRERATAATVVAMDRGRNRAAFHHPGGTFGFAPEQVPAAVLAGSGVVLLTSYHLLPRFRTSEGRAILAAAREGGAITALDLGPALPPLADLDELGAVLNHVTYLLANEHELTSCAGVDDLDTACARLLDAGASTIVVKRGAAGAAVVEAAGRRDVPGYVVSARSTVGAGDSFNAGFLASVARGEGAVEAARFGNAVAALVVESAVGVLGSPTRAEVLAFVARQGDGAGRAGR